MLSLIKLAAMDYSKFYFLFTVLLLLSISEARTSEGASYYPRTKGLPWAKREQPTLGEGRPSVLASGPGTTGDKSNIVGSYGQFYSIQRQGLM